MTPERIEQERKAFEEWFYENICGIQLPLNKSEIGRYCNFYAEDMFTAWCAAKSHAEQSEWISVKDRLPEYKNDSEQFLIMCQWKREPKTYFYKTSRLLKMLDHIYFDSEPCGAAVIYWQPFPAPPTTNPAA